MKIQIKLFAAAKQIVGRDSLDVELGDSATVRDLREALSARCPELSTLISQSRFAVNAEYVGDAARITTTDEIAMIPPVSGG